MKNQQTNQRLGCDETAVMFVPRSKYTYVIQGKKKINKPFKGKIKQSFRDFLYRQYNTWVIEGNNADEWAPKFGMGELKPNITGWVQDGIAAISTPEMKQSIRRAFANDGRFTEIRARAARSQVIEDEIRIQELLGQLSLF